jgi:hypothetical protein
MRLLCCLAAFAFLKNSAFAEEHEWRAVLFAFPGQFLDRLDFFESAGVMKPCMPILRGSTGGALPLRRVISGASRSIEQSVRSAQLMLATCGYDGVVVEPSQVPMSG